MTRGPVRAPSIDRDTELSRHAFNAAFNELGLMWSWDRSTHQQLQRIRDERERVRVYLPTEQSHLLKAYDAEFLVDAIHALKQRHLALASA